MFEKLKYSTKLMRFLGEVTTRLSKDEVALENLARELKRVQNFQEKVKEDDAFLIKHPIMVLTDALFNAIDAERKASIRIIDRTEKLQALLRLRKIMVPLPFNNKKAKGVCFQVEDAIAKLKIAIEKSEKRKKQVSA